MAENLEIIITADDRASEALNRLGGIARGALTVGLGIAAAGATALAGGLAFSVTEAMAAQEIQAQLEAVLKSTGGAAGVTAEMANDLATSLSQVTRFEDDVIVSAEAVLLRFREIGSDVFPDATAITLDLATALGIDATSAATMLGKALETPGEGLLRLRAAGVSFTDAQIDMIQGMAEAGDMAGAQRMILEELQGTIGGAAEAAGQTFAGQLDILKNSLGNVAEEVGMQLLPFLQAFLNDVVVPMIPNIQAFAMNVANLAIGFIQFLGSLQPVADFLKANWEPILIGMVTLIVGLVIPSLVTWATTAGTAALATITALAPVVLPVLAIAAAAAFLAAAWDNNWGGIRDKTQAVIDFIRPYIENALAAIRGWWDAHGAAILGAAQTAWDGIMAVVQRVIGVVQSIFEAFRSAFEGDWRGFGENLRAAWDQVWGLIADIARNAWNILRGAISELIDNVINFFRTADWGEIGRNIVQGIAAGIDSAVDWIWRAIQGVGAAALDAIKGFLGISSPSRVMMGIGVNMMQGMAMGIAAGGMLPVTAMQGVSQATTNVANNEYTLNMYSNAPSEDVVMDFQMMRVLGRR